MIEHWGASEREILLSKGPRDNPNMEHLRKFYHMMYFVKDHSEEDSVVYFVNRQFFSDEVHKILLPRKIRFLDTKVIREFSLPILREEEISVYVVFRKEDKPDFCRIERIMWDGGGCGIYRVE